MKTRKLCYRKDDRAMRHGCPENFRDSLAMPTSTFPKKFSWAFILIHPMHVRTQFKVRSFTCSWVNRGYPVYPQIGAVPGYPYTRGGRGGREWYRSKERWWHSNFSSIFTRFRDIAAFVLQDATFPYPTSSLPPKISPCSSGNRWIAFSLQRAKVLG